MGLQRHSNLAAYALGNVLKYYLRTVTIVFAIIMASSLLCSTEFIREGVEQDISRSLEEGPDIIVQKLSGGRQVEVPEVWLQNMSDVAGVAIATPRVWGYTDIGSGSLLTVMGIEPEEYQQAANVVGTDVLENGRFLNSSDYRKMIVGEGIIDLMRASAARVEVGIGSVLSLISQNGSLLEFQIIGIFSSQSKIFSYDLILTDIHGAREVFGLSNESVTDIAVWTDSGAYLNDVAFRLDTRFSEARILSRDAISDNMLKTYGGRAGIISLIWTMMIIIVLLITFTVSSAGSDEVRREVGLLKALGFDTVDIIEIRMFETFTLGLLGGSLGISFAIIYTYILGAPLLAGYLLGWNLLLLNAGIPLAISPVTLFIIYTVSIIPVMAASVIPSWRSSIVEPDIVLRGV